MREWIGQKVRIFIRNLNDKPIVYTATILSVEDGFITFTERNGEKICVNIKDIIQIKEEPQRDSDYNGSYQA